MNRNETKVARTRSKMIAAGLEFFRNNTGKLPRVIDITEAVDMGMGTLNLRFGSIEKFIRVTGKSALLPYMPSVAESGKQETSDVVYEQLIDAVHKCYATDVSLLRGISSATNIDLNAMHRTLLSVSMGDIMQEYSRPLDSAYHEFLQAAYVAGALCSALIVEGRSPALLSLTVDKDLLTR